jgi:hypothetical protein
MNPHDNRTRLAGVLVAVAAALALVALPGIASAHRGDDSLADAGTIQSFDPESGALTIHLTEGGVSGLVTPRTHIHCDNGRHEGRHGLRHDLRQGATASDRGPGSGGDDGEGEGEDNHRHGEEEPGDEHGESCGVDDLTAGKTVKFADLVLVGGKAIWSTVALPQSEEETAG